jgi:hypothetical protein
MERMAVANKNIGTDKNYSDEMKWACLDGELTTAESAELARSLLPEQWRELEGEMRLESGIAEALGAPAPCPADVWQAARDRVCRAEREHAKRGGWRALYLSMAGLAAAAMLAMGVFGVMWDRGRPKETPVERAEFLFLPEADVPSLAALSQISGAVPDARAFLQEKAVQVAFDPMGILDDESSPYKLLGAREDVFHGERVIQLFFDHDGSPAKIVIADVGGAAAAEIGKALAGGNVRASRSVGNVLAAVVGQRGSRDLLAFFEDPDEQEAVAPDVEQGPAVEAVAVGEEAETSL